MIGRLVTLLWLSYDLSHGHTLKDFTYYLYCIGGSKLQFIVLLIMSAGSTETCRVVLQ
jgi:hypothetical protein